MAGRSRDAVSTIKGYYYQFDYYILQLLSLENDNDSVRIEGIEDVDIITEDSTKAVQCKYYDGTACSPSVVGKAIRPMLIHFSENKANQPAYSYRLFGHYGSGQSSIVQPLTVEFAKQKLFTYTEKNVHHVLHTELGLADDEIQRFLDKLDLQLYATIYEDQVESIIGRIQNVLQCSEYDARFFYYNNAVSFVKEIAVKKTTSARTVTKKRFIDSICSKRVLFDKWYIEYIGFEKYYRASRKECFTKANVSPAHRLFLLDCTPDCKPVELADIVIKICEKWSKLSVRERMPFCPYIYLNGLSSSRLAEVKRILYENDFHIWDGYEYKDADFEAKSLTRQINYNSGINAKIINKADHINMVLEACDGLKEVFQFYVGKPFYTRGSVRGRDFQVQHTVDILKII